MAARVSVWILGDQLAERHPALTEAEKLAEDAKPIVTLIERPPGRGVAPFHRKRQVLVTSALRHYADALREDGWSVDYRCANDTGGGLASHCAAHHPTTLVTMAASTYEKRQVQNRLSARLGIPVTVLPNTHFLAGRFDPVPDDEPGKRVIMARFYRAMRRRFGLLLDEDGTPTGGKWSHDAANRRPYRDEVPLPEALTFAPDATTQRVMAEVEAAGQGAGSARDFGLAVTRSQALRALDAFLDRCLRSFGPFEDAMTQSHATLFHSVLSPYLNLGLLEPLEVARAAVDRFLAGAAPINSVEGFVRQVIGWREFMYWQYWRRMPGFAKSNHWDAQRPLPGFFWSGRTELHCLRHALKRAIELGYTHHIERLMLLCNFCQLAGVEPVQVNDWFMRHYVDAYEWVMYPNVLGMGLYADGGLTATKPYIASANYIHRMSDYCEGCAYDPGERTGPHACPFNYLYWNFLIAHEDALRANPRLGPAVLGLRHLSDSDRRTVRESAERFLEAL